MIKFYTSLVFFLGIMALSQGQCINTFPYLEDFETAASWTTGGANNDWAWGTPTKTVINSAGSGTKCWITGGLSGNFYNYSEASWVQSPCFDFTNLQHPFIQFLIFWESENKYDGTNLQYSLDGGSTWNNVGAYGDAVNCLNNNWYNINHVNYLTGLANPAPGWLGNIQPTAGNCQGGGGLGHWVTANHCMAYLAGQPNVTFRFTFGAGTTCNNFNGIAFDSVAIGEAPANAGTIAYTCGSFNTISFTGTASLCPDTISWNFGDPNSGANDSASTLTAGHAFSAPGTYNVSLTLAGPCNAPATINQTVQVLGVTATPTNGGCGTNGSIAVSVSGGSGGYTYSWSGGLSGQNPTNVAAGTYTVTVSTSQSCPATAQATVSQSTGSFTASIAPTNTTCGANNGSATASVSGSSGNLTYLWSNNSTGATASNLGAGTYTVTVSNTSGCTATASVTISNSSGVTASTSSTAASCTGGGTATVNAAGGNGSYTYVWSSGATTQTASGLSAGNYTVTVNDAGCSATATASVGTSGSAISIVPTITAATCGSANGSASIVASGDGNSYTYDWSTGSTISSISNQIADTYTVTVDGAGGCSATASIVIGSAGGLTVATNVTPTTCGENNGSASVNVTSGPGPYTYSWSNSTTNYNIASAASGGYSVTVNGSGGCSATASVNIASSVGIILNITSTNATCGNSNGSLVATVAIGTAPYTYNWSNSATTATISNLAAGNYNITVHDNAGCSASASATVSSTAGTSVTASSNKTIMCSGDTATVCANGTFASYAWNTGDTTQCIQTPYAGNYYLTVTDGNNCTAASNQVAITLYSPTPVTISISGDTLTSYTAVSYQWYLDGQAIAGATTQTIIATQSGVYTVQVVDNNGCHYYSSPADVNVASISDLNDGQPIIVYPNPLSGGNWYLDVIPVWLGAHIEVYDVSGQVIYRGEITSLTSQIPLQVANGIYLLRVSTETNSMAIKLIKL